METASELPPGIPRPGAIFADRCRIVSVLGVGGMGVVFEAQHLRLRKRVALKMLLPKYARDPEVVERFIREGRAASKIHGENVVRVLDVGKLDTGEAYMIMEHLEGENLGERINRQPLFPIEDAVDIVVEACSALAEAHAQGIVHRDIKPSNLFLTKTPAGEVVKLVDFGISKVLEGEGASSLELTKTTDVFGSPMYMSPEQLSASKHVDTRTDVWAIGVILYEIVTGVRPFTGGSLAEISVAVLTREPTRPIVRRSELPPEVSAAIMKCLVRDPEMRTASVLELAREIAPFGSARARSALARADSFAAQLPQPRDRATVDASPTTFTGPPTSMPKRSMVSIAIVLAVIFALVGVGALVFTLRARAATNVIPAPPSASSVVEEPPAPPPPPSETASVAAPPESAAPSAKRQPRVRVPPPRPSAAPSASAAPSSDRFR